MSRSNVMTMTASRYKQWAAQQDNLFKNPIESLAMWCTLEVEQLAAGDYRITYHPWPESKKCH